MGELLTPGGRGTLGGHSIAEPPPLARYSFPRSKAFPWVRLPCFSERCARLPSTIAHSPLGGIQILRASTHTLFLARIRVRSHPRPRPRGGVPFSEEGSYLSFHSLPRVARIARPIVSKPSSKHSGDIHSWEREQGTGTRNVKSFIPLRLVSVSRIIFCSCLVAPGARAETLLTPE